MSPTRPRTHPTHLTPTQRARDTAHEIMQHEPVHYGTPALILNAQFSLCVCNRINTIESVSRRTDTNKKLNSEPSESHCCVCTSCMAWRRRRAAARNWRIVRMCRVTLESIMLVLCTITEKHSRGWLGGGVRMIAYTWENVARGVTRMHLTEWRNVVLYAPRQNHYCYVEVCVQFSSALFCLASHGNFHPHGIRQRAYEFVFFFPFFSVCVRAAKR